MFMMVVVELDLVLSSKLKPNFSRDFSTGTSAIRFFFLFTFKRTIFVMQNAILIIIFDLEEVISILIVFLVILLPIAFALRYLFFNIFNINFFGKIWELTNDLINLIWKGIICNLHFTLGLRNLLNLLLKNNWPTRDDIIFDLLLISQLFLHLQRAEPFMVTWILILLRFHVQFSTYCHVSHHIIALICSQRLIKNVFLTLSDCLFSKAHWILVFSLCFFHIRKLRIYFLG